MKFCDDVFHRQRRNLPKFWTEKSFVWGQYKEFSSLFRQKFLPKTHGRIYRHFNRKAKYLTDATKLARFVDYTSATCRFSIPILLPDLIYVNIIIFNRDQNNSHSNSSMKNITLQDVVQLINYNKKYYPKPILPTFLPMISSATTLQTVTTDDVGITTQPTEHDDDEPLLTSNIVVLDEKLLWEKENDISLFQRFFLLLFLDFSIKNKFIQT